MIARIGYDDRCGERWRSHVRRNGRRQPYGVRVPGRHDQRLESGVLRVPRGLDNVYSPFYPVVHEQMQHVSPFIVRVTTVLISRTSISY